jgi:endonuclease/exonuclease/phosphatase family metal-dependent hydrolase
MLRHAIVLTAALCVLVPGTGAEHPPPTEPVLTIATYNINWGNADLPGVARTIRKAEADIVALQEVNAVSESHLRKRFGRDYPHSVFKPGDAASGFGFLSKRPLANVRFLEPKHGFFGTYLADVMAGGKSIQLVNVHLQPAIPKDGAGAAAIIALYQKTETTRAKEMERIGGHLAKNRPVVVLGDFNSLPGGMATAPLAGRGFKDSFAETNPDRTQATTWHWTWRGTEVKFRFDYIFPSRDFRTIESRIIPSDASDHDLVVSRLAWVD